jgi:hypothetical protein
MSVILVRIYSGQFIAEDCARESGNNNKLFIIQFREIYSYSWVRHGDVLTTLNVSVRPILSKIYITSMFASAVT